MQKKKGISLIVLVITIIVMIILASAVIISLSNTGIIDKAGEAVDKTNEKQVEELANLAWGEAYIKGKRTASDLTDAVKKALEDNDIEMKDYGIDVTQTGVKIVKGWLKRSDGKIVKGDKELDIGDEIYYDETNNNTISGLTNVGWKVLGAENGELLIMSTSEIDGISFGNDENAELGRASLETGIYDLNMMCEPYGKGAYATKVRSITAEDIEEAIGYDKTTYKKGNIGEYGNEITVINNESLKPKYTTSNGSEGNDATLKYNHDTGFYWYDWDGESGKYKCQSIDATALQSNENGGKTIVKFKNSFYVYNKSSNVSDKINNMFFGSKNESFYWLATFIRSFEGSSVTYGFPFVTGGTIDSPGIVGSSGVNMAWEAGVRAVVFLSNTLELEGSHEEGWSFKI